MTVEARMANLEKAGKTLQDRGAEYLF